MVAVAWVGEVPPLIVPVDWGAVVWIREVVVVGASGVMVAGVEVVVIGVNREGGQRRGEIGRRTDGLEVKKMIGRVRADEDGEIEVREGEWGGVFGV